MTPAKGGVDRPALIRRALVELVAVGGFRGTSMAAVAKRAGVATGTAYVHYASKEDLIVASYREVKGELGAAGADRIASGAPPAERFRQLWFAIYEHLAADPPRARFLIQFESLPYAKEVHDDYLEAEGNKMLETAMADDMAALLVELPLEVLFDLGLGPAVRLATAEPAPDVEVLERIARACWRAITEE